MGIEDKTSSKTFQQDGDSDKSAKTKNSPHKSAKLEDLKLTECPVCLGMCFEITFSKMAVPCGCCLGRGWVDERQPLPAWYLEKSTFVVWSPSRSDWQVNSMDVKSWDDRVQQWADEGLQFPIRTPIPPRRPSAILASQLHHLLNRTQLLPILPSVETISKSSEAMSTCSESSYTSSESSYTSSQSSTTSSDTTKSHFLPSPPPDSSESLAEGSQNAPPSGWESVKFCRNPEELASIYSKYSWCSDLFSPRKSQVQPPKQPMTETQPLVEPQAPPATVPSSPHGPTTKTKLQPRVHLTRLSPSDIPSDAPRLEIMARSPRLSRKYHLRSTELPLSMNSTPSSQELRTVPLPSPSNSKTSSHNHPRVELRRSSRSSIKIKETFLRSEQGYRRSHRGKTMANKRPRRDGRSPYSV